MHAFQISQRRACNNLGIHRSSCRYQHRRDNQDWLRRKVREVAAQRPHYGARRIHIMLRREGFRFNHKRIYRLYTEEGLTMRKYRAKKRASAKQRLEPVQLCGQNQLWSMDFIHSRLADGRPFRVLTLVDLHTRESPRLYTAPRMSGRDVIAVLDEAIRQHGKPAAIRVDNGTEFTSNAVDQWAYKNGIKLDFTRPGKPTDNAHIESFNGKFRKECLNAHWFVSIDEAKCKVEEWRWDYNNNRPHSSLGDITPREFAAREANSVRPNSILRLLEQPKLAANFS